MSLSLRGLWHLAISLLHIHTFPERYDHVSHPASHHPVLRHTDVSMTYVLRTIITGQGSQSALGSACLSRSCYPFATRKPKLTTGAFAIPSTKEGRGPTRPLLEKKCNKGKSVLNVQFGYSPCKRKNGHLTGTAGLISVAIWEAVPGWFTCWAARHVPSTLLLLLSQSPFFPWSFFPGHSLSVFKGT